MNESVLEEAQRLTTGERQDSYGHPFHDFSRTAGMISALLGHKLKAEITPEDVAMIMVCVKLSREQNQPKHDNVVDAAGYLNCLDMVKQYRGTYQAREGTTTID